MTDPLQEEIIATERKYQSLEPRSLMDVYNKLPKFEKWDKSSSQRDKFVDYCSLVMKVASLENDIQLLTSMIAINNLTEQEGSSNSDEEGEESSKQVNKC
jgi:hypothetical protein